MAINKNSNWPPYDLVRDVQALKRQAKQIQLNAKGSAWYDYTPSWNATTTSPGLGSAVLRSQYQRVGSTCHYQVQLAMASDTAYGTGTWTFSTPFPVQQPAGVSGACIGSVLSHDNSGFSGYPGIVLMDFGLGALTLWCSAGGPRVSNVVPFTWATNDLLYFTTTYQVAEGY